MGGANKTVHMAKTPPAKLDQLRPSTKSCPPRSTWLSPPCRTSMSSFRCSRKPISPTGRRSNKKTPRCENASAGRLLLLTTVLRYWWAETLRIDLLKGKQTPPDTLPTRCPHPHRLTTHREVVQERSSHGNATTKPH